MRYEIIVDFDDSTADVVTSRTYYSVLEKYNAWGIGHEKTKTSSMFIKSEKPLDLEALANDLARDDIKILSVRKAA